MKNYLGLILLLLIFTSCNKDSNQSNDVDDYISDLQNDEFEGFFLPQFNVEDIDQLMNHINDESIISVFPVNPISSMYMPENRVGVVVLWTIESIRLSELNPKLGVYEQYPSLNPILIENQTNTILINSVEALNNAAEAYSLWWTNDISLNNKMSIDPLKDVELHW